ncbi:hypothetical protein RFI_06525 [Reticulomyxa filosa]|uniref:Uncharacterized protein n=1 Tax=Reticulomyxa filosa TaxID=46433 RepID=X6NWA8_RETFI|nr:hypothetical protein RFI_06525 [Reticulomyxa filosa]|eukprot:ETO30595.1 hypothetical protein RFI_06525 [Reticulomyxa filosa]
MVILFVGIYVWGGIIISKVARKQKAINETCWKDSNENGSGYTAYNYIYLGWAIWYWIVPLSWYLTLGAYFKTNVMKQQLKLLDMPSVVKAFGHYNPPIQYKIGGIVYVCLVLTLVIFNNAEDCNNTNDLNWFNRHWWLYFVKNCITIVPPLLIFVGFTLIHWIASIHRTLYGRLLFVLMAQQKLVQSYRLQRGKIPPTKVIWNTIIKYYRKDSSLQMIL